MKILRNIKSLKVRILLIVFTLLFFGFFSHYKIQTKALKEMYEPYNFPYSQATEHFIKAMSMATYIHRLHTIIDYDNPIMKPLLNQLNEEYEKGKSLLPKNSAEDVYWYVIVYRQIYGIGGVPDRRDMSLSFEKNLKTKEDFKKHYEEILNKIRRLVENDFNYDVPKITQYKFEVMSNLIGEMQLAFYRLSARDKSVLKDKKYLKDLYDVNSYFKQYSEKYLLLANKQEENKIQAKYLDITILNAIQVVKTYQNILYCVDRENLILIEYIKELKNMENIKGKDYLRIKEIFEEDESLYGLLNKLKNCSKLKEETTEVLKYFSPELNNKLNKGEANGNNR